MGISCKIDLTIEQCNFFFNFKFPKMITEALDIFNKYNFAEIM